MSLVAPIPALSRPRRPDRRARLAAIAFALAVHVLAILAVVLTGVSLAPPIPPPPVALELRPPPPPTPQPVAPKRRAGGSPASTPKRAAASSPRPQPAKLHPVHIRPPAPVPLLPAPLPTLAAPKGPELASPVTGAGVSVGTGGQGAGQGDGPGGPGGRGESEPIWTQGPTPRQIGDAYPRDAYKAGRGGSVTLRCRELSDGRVDRCTVLDETPPGEGFGRAALKLSRAFRFRPFTLDGRTQEATLVIPYDLSVYDEGPRANDD